MREDRARPVVVVFFFFGGGLRDERKRCVLPIQQLHILNFFTFFASEVAGGLGLTGGVNWGTRRRRRVGCMTREGEVMVRLTLLLLLLLGGGGLRDEKRCGVSLK